jgi:hypothetical protein
MLLLLLLKVIEDENIKKQGQDRRQKIRMLGICE